MGISKNLTRSIQSKFERGISLNFGFTTKGGSDPLKVGFKELFLIVECC